MKKIFGIEGEINLTADDDICKGIGKGLEKGSIKFDEIFKEIKPELVKGIKKLLEDTNNDTTVVSKEGTTN